MTEPGKGPARLEFLEGLPDRSVAAASRRIVKRTWTATSAADAVGDIPPGASVFGVSKGRWSLLDLFDHLLTLCDGPASCVISTWSAAMADGDQVFEWIRSGRISDCRLILDFTLTRVRLPEHLDAFIARFGLASIRLTDNHCKFLVIRGGSRAFSVVTSMNLNENLRLEWWQVDDDTDRVAYLLELADLIFASINPDKQLEITQHDVKRQLGKMGEADAAAAIAEQEKRQRFWFGTGAWDQDVRRAGLTYQQG